MTRSLIAIAGVFGLAFLVYDAIQYPWWSPLFSAHILECTLGLTCHLAVLWILAILILRRLWVIPFFLQLFCDAVRWRHYLGAAELGPFWTDDLNPDAD